MYLNFAFLVIFSINKIDNRRKTGNNVFPNRSWGITMSKRPGFFLKTIMFSFVGTKPQFAKVEIVVKIEKVSKLMCFVSRILLALGIRFK